MKLKHLNMYVMVYGEVSNGKKLVSYEASWLAYKKNKHIKQANNLNRLVEEYKQKPNNLAQAKRKHHKPSFTKNTRRK